MKVLQVAGSSLAGAPCHLAKMLRKYGGIDSTSVLLERFKSPGLSGLSWDYDVVEPTVDEVVSMAKDYDVIHFHQYPQFHPPVKNGSPVKSCITYHAQPYGYVPGVSNAEFNGRKFVVCNYHAMFYTDARVVPNMLDIWDPLCEPGPRPDHVRVLFAYASEGPGWANKGSRMVNFAFDALLEKFPSVEFITKTNTPWRDLMALKRTCHICLSDVGSGAFHQSEMEAMAVGAVCVTAVSPAVENVIIKFTGGTALPVERVDQASLLPTLESLLKLSGKDLLVKGAAGSRWVAQFWDPEVQVKTYKRIYEGLLK